MSIVYIIIKHLLLVTPINQINDRKIWPPHTLGVMITPQVQVLVECGGKGRGSSLQEGASHTYTLKLG